MRRVRYTQGRINRGARGTNAVHQSNRACKPYVETKKNIRVSDAVSLFSFSPFKTRYILYSRLTTIQFFVGLSMKYVYVHIHASTYTYLFMLFMTFYDFKIFKRPTKVMSTRTYRWLIRPGYSLSHENRDWI